jgi:membrane protein implicated in regulation of membrane protease activity
VFERLWRLKEAIIVFSIAGMAVLLAPTALWVRAVGFAAATVVYWRYVWKYKGVREETAAALERERERQRRAADDDE